jgi:DNA-binding response OmpR family regulator
MLIVMKNTNLIGTVQTQQPQLVPMKNTIVIADDDKAILEVMKMILEMHDYNVLTIDDGNLFPSLVAIQPKLLFLDINMSGVNGGEICRRLKASVATKDIPVIMISANYDIREITKDAGADDYLAKPFELRDLLSKVNKYLLN